MKKIIFILLILVIFISGCFNNPYASLENNPKVDSRVVGKIKSSSLDTVHAMIQFDHVLNVGERKSLEGDNIIFHGYNGNNSYTASIPVSGIENLTQITYVKRIIPVPLEIKMERYFLYGKIPNSAFNDDGTIKLNVIFYYDIPEERAVEVITKYGDIIINGYEREEYEENLPEDYDIYFHALNNDSVLQLGKEDEVRYVGFGGWEPGISNENYEKKDTLSCDSDDDCIFDWSEENSCYSPLPQLINKETKERRAKWREENCDEEEFNLLWQKYKQGEINWEDIPEKWQNFGLSITVVDHYNQSAGPYCDNGICKAR